MRTDRLTTALDLTAFVLLAIAAGMGLWLLWPPAGPAGAAIVLLASSWFIDRQATTADTDEEAGA